MSKLGGLLVIILAMMAGFGGGWVYSATLGKTPTPTTTTTTTTATTTTATATKQTLEECLTGVWGKDKYAAITANSNLATTEDNLASLKCYKQ